METTRHFVATVYVVNDGATALHHHDRLDMWLPPGGHIERDELPHVAARREVREELGREVDLLTGDGRFDTGSVESLPRAEQLLLEDINVHAGGAVGHQHIDFVYFGRVHSRRIDPENGEQAAEDWRWVDPEELAALDPEPDVAALAREAVEALG